MNTPKPASPEPGAVEAFVCGGSGNLSDVAKDELRDYATYLQLKARFDKQRAAAPRADAPVRELVTLWDDATIACPSCAKLLKGAA